MGGSDVYFNLTRRVWSVRDRATGLVRHHARVVLFMDGARLIVNPAGRAKVLETGVKNVHAFVRGTGARFDDVESWPEWIERDGTRGFLVSYNPKKAGHFTRRDTGERVDALSAAVLIAENGKPPVVWGLAA